MTTFLLCAQADSLFSDSEAVGYAEQIYETTPVASLRIVMENLTKGSSFDEKQILGKLHTKVGDPFSSLVFDQDLKKIAEDYDQVDPAISQDSAGLHITLKVWARPSISSIQWEGNTHIPTKTLQKELSIKKGAIFNVTSFNQSLQKVREYYLKQGYFESHITYTVSHKKEDNSVDISLSVYEGSPGIIDRLQFEGFTSQEESDVLSKLYTSTYNRLVSWFTGSGTYKEEMVEQDLLTMTSYFQDKGYADARVHIESLPSPKEGRIILVIHVDKGELYHVGKISFKGNKMFTDEAVEKQFLVHPGDIYSPERLRETAQAIKDLYGRKGYIDTDVQFESYLQPGKNLYNVRFTIEEGSIYKIGMIKVFGNIQTQTHVILRESLLVPGETFDSAKLKATQQKLESIGYFKHVSVYAVRTEDDQFLGENYRDVYIEVEETTTGNLSLFFGLSSGEGGFGGLDLTETNFNYKGFGKIFSEGPSALRGGGEYAHAKATLGSKQRSYTMAWATPYFRDSLWRIGFDGFISQSKLQAKSYKIDSLGGSMTASYPFNAYWAFSSRYRFKHALIDVSPNASYQEQQAEKGSGNVSAISGSFNFDSTDNLFKPRSGFRSILEAEFAGLGGNFSFFKYNYLNSYYIPLWRTGIMKYRWDFQFIQPIWRTRLSSQIPLSERFFSGGENSVRGYRTYDLGDHFPNGDPTGGISNSVLSMEFLQEIFPILDGFLFIDAGAISLKKFDLPRYNVSWGFGLRIHIAGNRLPIVVGMGFPVNAKDRSQIQRFYFSMGGQF